MFEKVFSYSNIERQAWFFIWTKPWNALHRPPWTMTSQENHETILILALQIRSGSGERIHTVSCFRDSLSTQNSEFLQFTESYFLVGPQSLIPWHYLNGKDRFDSKFPELERSSTKKKEELRGKRIGAEEEARRRKLTWVSRRKRNLKRRRRIDFKKFWSKTVFQTAIRNSGRV